MKLFSFLASIAAWLGAVTGLGSGGGQDVRRVVVSDEMIIRVPVVPLRSTPAIDWSEHKGPKCLDSKLVTGARLAGPNAIDFMLVDHSRIRAKLENRCPGLDFYGGFYLSTGDERICAKRDQIRSRMGDSCRIEAFRTLVPVLKH
ncbi:hypothetical protein ABDK56_12475 [Sphingomonas sp. ASV193]|uniref:hypothetical protein n=1 Tax=Sphingomonas sp. ASV193 TaxID=3144405 RepID=UPI0032E8B8EB